MCSIRYELKNLHETPKLVDHDNVLNLVEIKALWLKKLNFLLINPSIDYIIQISKLWNHMTIDLTINGPTYGQAGTMNFFYGIRRIIDWIIYGPKYVKPEAMNIYGIEYDKTGIIL